MLISSLHNPRVKAAARLRDRQGRDEQGRIIIDGVREIGLALAAGVEVSELYCFPELCRGEHEQRLLATAKAARAELIEVTPYVMEKLAFGNRVEGAVAIANLPQKKLADLSLASDAMVAVVEGVEKPGNLGAVLRTADTAGVGAVIVAGGVTDLYNPNVIRASLGALFTVPVCAAPILETLTWLRQQNFRMFAARVDAPLEYTQTDFRGRTAIALGSEAHGLSDAWRANDVTAIHLPMLGQIDSLNLSVTAAVLFFEALRQRRAKQPGNL